MLPAGKRTRVASIDTYNGEVDAAFPTMSVTLPVRGYDVLSAYPVHQLFLGQEKVSLAVLGLLGKMVGACAIISSDLRITENGKRLIWMPTLSIML